MRLLAAQRSTVRPEIQLLRAIAVLLVVLFHLWPGRLPGGYVGVDVFFVISGYLITSHLLREIDRSGTVRLGAFWARRARRLLPASLLVILLSAIATFLFIPQTFRNDFFKQMAGATLYVVNWVLAADSVDYLAADNNASPVQHFWSLSVEEQFYLVWPLLILLALWLAKGRSRRRYIVIVLAVATAASLVASVWLTHSDPAPAYFATYTRAWQFGAGALLVFLRPLRSEALRVVLGWAGSVGILVAGFWYDEGTPFPGYAALLPTLAAGAVIWAGTTTSAFSIAQLSRFRPIQYLGDISYSLYLWHWPPIVILPYALGHALNGREKLALLAVCILLAALTKRFVEDPVRTATFLVSRKARATFWASAAAMMLTLTASVGGWAIARADTASAAAEAASFDATANCVGANFLLDEGCANEPGGELVPSAAAIRDDMAMTDCNNNTPTDGELVSCSFGAGGDGALKVALTGDSHARQWAPGIIPYLDDLGWTMDTYFSRGCLWSDPNPNEPECDTYRTAISDKLTSGEYDLIIVTGLRGANTNEKAADKLASLRLPEWQKAIDAGTQVLVLGDNPVVPDDMVDCVIDDPDGAESGEDCILDGSRATEPVDYYTLAASQDDRIAYVSLMDLYCFDDTCPMVIGDVVVYRDKHHLTATYVKSAAPTLIERMTSELDRLKTTGAKDGDGQ